MARISKTVAVDFSQSHTLSPGLLERATCPDGCAFALLRDADTKGLRLRITKSGGKHWQYETRLKGGKLFTRSLGEWSAITIRAAQSEARDPIE